MSRAMSLVVALVGVALMLAGLYLITPELALIGVGAILFRTAQVLS